MIGLRPAFSLGTVVPFYLGLSVLDGIRVEPMLTLYSYVAAVTHGVCCHCSQSVLAPHVCSVRNMEGSTLCFLIAYCVVFDPPGSLHVLCSGTPLGTSLILAEAAAGFSRSCTERDFPAGRPFRHFGIQDIWLALWLSSSYYRLV